MAAWLGDLVAALFGLEEAPGFRLGLVLAGDAGDRDGLAGVELRGVAGVGFGVREGVGLVVCAVLQLQAPHVRRQ